jgi:hypothetical protein
MKLTDGEVVRLRGIMDQLPAVDAGWLHAFVSRHAEPCRRWPSDRDFRDEAIREAYTAYYVGLGPTLGSQALATDLLRWEASGWRRHEGDPLPPGINERDLAIHRIQMAKAGAIGARQIFTILTAVDC